MNKQIIADEILILLILKINFNFYMLDIAIFYVNFNLVVFFDRQELFVSNLNSFLLSLMMTKYFMISRWSKYIRVKNSTSISWKYSNHRKMFIFIFLKGTYERTSAAFCIWISIEFSMSPWCGIWMLARIYFAFWILIWDRSKKQISFDIYN